MPGWCSLARLACALGIVLESEQSFTSKIGALTQLESLKLTPDPLYPENKLCNVYLPPELVGQAKAGRMHAQWGGRGEEGKSNIASRYIFMPTKTFMPTFRV